MSYCLSLSHESAKVQKNDRFPLVVLPSLVVSLVFEEEPCVYQLEHLLSGADSPFLLPPLSFDKNNIVREIDNLHEKWNSLQSIFQS